jgi:ABC-2 type transport system permease protein
MNKMFAVFKREYLQAVRKKSFIIMTLLFPFLMAAMMLLPALLVSRGMGDKKVAIIDGTSQLRGAFVAPNEKEPVDAKKEARDAMTGRRSGPDIPQNLLIEYVPAQTSNLEEAVKPYLPRLGAEDEAQKLNAIFFIPGNALDAEDAKLTYYSRSAADIATQERLSRMTNKAIQRHRLEANGIQPDSLDRLMREVEVDSVQMSRSGEQKKGGEANLILGFIFAAMLLLPSFIYGNETMRGIVQEKSDRVVEVLVSSVKPMQLLSGKILGVAAVGLTQIAVWATMGLALGSYAAAIQVAAGENIAQFLRPIVFLYFIIFFVLAYLTYVCVYAIAGAVSNSEKEAQQFIAPISILMMAPWFVMFPIIMNPDSKLAVGFSLSPVFGPITMFVRTLVSEPPAWHIVVSIVVSIVTIAAFSWITAKIFRIGILSYGKRPTLPEMWKWLKAA